jgi:hypothetical protein
MEQFGVAREQLQRKVEADPTDPFLVTPLAYADLALGRKEDSIQEGKRAMEMRPISEDAVDGPDRATNSLSSPGPSRLTTEHTLLRALACQPGLKPAES